MSQILSFPRETQLIESLPFAEFKGTGKVVLRKNLLISPLQKSPFCVLTDEPESITHNRRAPAQTEASSGPQDGRLLSPACGLTQVRLRLEASILPQNRGTSSPSKVAKGLSSAGSYCKLEAYCRSLFAKIAAREVADRKSRCSVTGETYIHIGKSRFVFQSLTPGAQRASSP